MTDTRVLAVANQKGGVAKTTTVASLGAAMVEKGRRVLLVDLDPQGCLTFSLGQDPDKLPVSVHEVLLGEVEPNAVLVTTMEGMTLLPANIDLAGAEAMLLMRAGREYALKRALAKFSDRFDVVIIDCPPSLGVLTLNGLTAADEAIVPLQCEMLAHRGVGQFLRTVADVQQITNPNLRLLGALPTLYDSRTTHTRDVLLDVADRYDLQVLAPPIPRTVRFAEASASGSSVMAGRKNKGAVAYHELAQALLKHWKTGRPLPTFTVDLSASRRKIARNRWLSGRWGRRCRRRPRHRRNTAGGGERIGDGFVRCTRPTRRHRPTRLAPINEGFGAGPGHGHPLSWRSGLRWCRKILPPGPLRLGQFLIATPTQEVTG